jgi:hypothetical protein
VPPGVIDTFVEDQAATTTPTLMARIEHVPNATVQISAAYFHLHAHRFPISNRQELRTEFERVIHDIDQGRMGSPVSITPARRKRTNITQQQEGEHDAPPTKRVKTRTLKMEHATITFCSKDIPIPPAITFVDDIDRLDKVWDSVEDAVVSVKGERVPLKYWNQLWAGLDPQAWTILKQDYSDWKVRP